MNYMLLIYGDETQWTPPTSPEEMEAAMKPWQEYGEWLTAEGMMKDGNALQPTATATSVRGNGSDVLVSDGPFAETKEQLGGYYMIEAENLDRALEAAKRCPGAAMGTVEVRPVQVFD